MKLEIKSINQLKVAVVCLVCLCGVSLPCAAQQFNVHYTFTGASGSQVTTLPLSSSVPDLLTISGLTRGSGITTVSGAGSMAAGSWTTSVFDPNDYFTVNLSSSFGYRVRLDSIAFSERRSLTGPHGMSIRTSKDNFDADIFNAVLPDDTKVRRHDVATSGIWASLDEPLEIRWYGNSAESSNGTWRLGGSSSTAENPGSITTDLVLSGWMEPNAVVAPEPSSGAFILIMLPVLVLLFKRRPLTVQSGNLKHFRVHQRIGIKKVLHA